MSDQTEQNSDTKRLVGLAILEYALRNHMHDTVMETMNHLVGQPIPLELERRLTLALLDNDIHKSVVAETPLPLDNIHAWLQLVPKTWDRSEGSFFYIVLQRLVYHVRQKKPLV